MRRRLHNGAKSQTAEQALTRAMQLLKHIRLCTNRTECRRARSDAGHRWPGRWHSRTSAALGCPRPRSTPGACKTGTAFAAGNGTGTGCCLSVCGLTGEYGRIMPPIRQTLMLPLTHGGIAPYMCPTSLKLQHSGWRHQERALSKFNGEDPHTHCCHCRFCTCRKTCPDCRACQGRQTGRSSPRSQCACSSQ